MSKAVRVQFHIEGEENYGTGVKEALDTLAYSDVRFDVILGALNMRRMMYERWEKSEPPPSAEDAIKELTTGRPLRKKGKH